jgi:hypothetical protein
MTLITAENASAPYSADAGPYTISTWRAWWMRIVRHDRQRLTGRRIDANAVHQQYDTVHAARPLHRELALIIRIGADFHLDAKLVTQQVGQRAVAALTNLTRGHDFDVRGRVGNPLGAAARRRHGDLHQVFERGGLQIGGRLRAGHGRPAHDRDRRDAREPARRNHRGELHACVELQW